jgi:hypothetical protein
MSDDDKYIGHKLEQILDEVKAVHELVADVPTRGEFNELRQDVVELKQDMKVVKAAVTATNRDVAGLDRRVTRLEAA